MGDGDEIPDLVQTLHRTDFLMDEMDVRPEDDFRATRSTGLLSGSWRGPDSHVPRSTHMTAEETIAWAAAIERRVLDPFW
jgi:hypothetical protein